MARWRRWGKGSSEQPVTATAIVSPRTLAGATILQIVPALREEPVARTAMNVAYALLQSGARALIAAEDGPLADELRPLAANGFRSRTPPVNPFKLRSAARTRWSA